MPPEPAKPASEVGIAGETQDRIRPYLLKQVVAESASDLPEAKRGGLLCVCCLLSLYVR